uniref:MADF domain-containing protein n=1 Tax=Heterorhabditis bacteriophora TaxID=37862 RepID=A0A1I7X712_HETBA
MLAATTNRVDVGWTSARISVLIDAIKERPALWHSSHPHYRSMSKRKEYLSEVAEKVRSVAGGENINEDHVSGKWSILRECFNKQLKKVRGGGVSGWEHYARLVFLTPEVMSACRFDDLEAESHGTSNVDIVNSNGIGLDIQSQLEKMLGYVPEPLVSGECDPPIKRVKLSPKARERDIDADRQRTTRMQQASVVSTWVPPREDSIAAAMQAMTSTSTPPTATAQIVTTNSALTSILNKPRQSINGSISFNGEIPDQEDKWTLMGRMIEQTCRELEVKSHELAIHLQKDLNDIIFKYQLEGLKRK